MAQFKGVADANAALTIPELQEEGQYGGKVRSQWDSYTLLADLAVGDQILLGNPLPEGAQLVDGVLTYGALGGSAALEVGWLAGATGLEAAAPAGALGATTVSSAGVTRIHGATAEAAGFYRHIVLEQIQMAVQCTTASSGATGKVVQLEIFYIVD